MPAVLVTGLLLHRTLPFFPSGGFNHSQYSFLPTHGGMAQAELIWGPGSVPRWYFPVAAVQIWNSLPQHITSAASLPVFCSRLKTYTSTNSVTCNYSCRAREVTLSFMGTLIALIYLLTRAMRMCI